MKFHIGFFKLSREMETPFNLGRSRPEANLRHNNPSLKYFGSASESESKEHMEPSPYLSAKIKKNVADGLFDIYLS